MLLHTGRYNSLIDHPFFIISIFSQQLLLQKSWSKYLQGLRVEFNYKKEVWNTCNHSIKDLCSVGFGFIFVKFLDTRLVFVHYFSNFHRLLEFGKKIEYIHGPPTKFTQTCKQAGSVYSKATWSCDMSYERKFCGLSEYVQCQKVGQLIKSTDRY